MARVVNEKRVTSGLNNYSEKLHVHNKRASSARSEKVESLTKQRMDWDNKIDAQKISQDLKHLDAFRGDIKRQLGTEKKMRELRNTRRETLSERRSE